MNLMILAIALIFVIILIFGVLFGFIYQQLPSNNPYKSQAGCESVGGDWNTETGKCLVSYKEAGKSCTDGGQCKSGVCSPPTLSSEEKKALRHGSILDIIGVCASSTEVTGCVPQVLNGVISAESMCKE